MIRICDVLFSAAALALLAPLFLLVAIVLRFTGEGEVFFSQERIGANLRRFKVLKFVTMKKDSPNIGTGTLTVKNDPRILPIGKFLRDSKINELPQLLNILVGQMSLIGPRPLTSQTLPNIDEGRIQTIYAVKPGLSGVASVYFRDEESLLPEGDEGLEIYNKAVAPFKAELDEWFASRRTFRTYCALIVLTVAVIIKPSARQLLYYFFDDLPIAPEQLSDLQARR